MPAICAFNHYERIRQRLPQEPVADKTPHSVNDILALSQQFDTYLFDAFGVLNVADYAIDGSVAHVSALRAMGKNVLVLSNAAAFGKPMMVEKFQRLGFDFSAEEIITSRDATLDGIKAYPDNMRWGVIGPKNGQEDLDALGIDHCFYDAPDFYACDGFLFLSSLPWNALLQIEFVHELDKRPRPVLLGNPDLIAPMGDHSSVESGTYVLLLNDHLFEHCQIFGKPYPAIYNLVAKRLHKLGKDLDHRRTIMCGDTLHTDILGGNAFGISTALITGHGFFKGLDPLRYIEQSDISPDFLMPQI